MPKEPYQTKILLIEDDQELVNVYVTKFRYDGYSFFHVPDGEAGLKEIHNFRPDIVLLDVLLPKKDGFSVLEEIKKDPETKDIPVVLLTNLGQDQDVQKGLDLGAISYLVKATKTPTQVVEEIERVLADVND